MEMKVIVRWAIFLTSLKLIILMTNETLKLVQSKTKQWPYYTNAYYKYTHGSFNTDNENYYYYY